MRFKIMIICPCSPPCSLRLAKSDRVLEAQQEVDVEEKSNLKILWIVLLVIMGSDLLFALKWWLTVNLVTGH